MKGDGVTRWMRLSVDFYTDDKLEQLTNDQLLLFIKLVAWSTQHQTEGVLPSSGIRAACRKHKKVGLALQKMVDVELLEVPVTHQRSTSDPPAIHQRYNIVAYSKWQMVQPGRNPKDAGQGPDSDGPLVRAGAGGRKENRTERSSKEHLDRSSLAPEPVRMIDGTSHRFLAGSGWVREHDSDTTNQAGKDQPASAPQGALDPEWQTRSCTAGQDQVRETEGT